MKYLKFFTIVLFCLFASCGGRNKDKELTSEHQEIPKVQRLDSEDELRRQKEDVKSNELNDLRKKIPDVDNPKNVSDLFYELEQGVFIVLTVLDEDLYSQGSGFFIANGIGITNYHVLEGSDKGFIQLSPDEIFPISDILATSPPDELDYVIFKTEIEGNKFLKISKEKSEIGEDVFAIGSPKGLSNSLTKGTISGFRPNHRIQIDATIDHGSSGGPLFNLQGEVIGITTSGVGTGSELNFAVDIQALPYNRFLDL